MKKSKVKPPIRTDAERWRYVSRVLAQSNSPKMSGQSSWRFRPLYRVTGATVEEAIDKAIEAMDNQ